MRRFPLLEMRVRLVKLYSLLYHALVQSHVQVQLDRGRPLIPAGFLAFSHDRCKLAQCVGLEYTGLARADRKPG